MSRPKQLRKMSKPPQCKGFKPYGYYGLENDPVLLHLEEFEAIRLIDHENLSQVDAAEIMKISRPTITRIYDSARKKVARSLTETRSLVIEGGRVYFDEHWFSCLFCFSTFNNPHAETEIHACPVCGGNKIESSLDAFRHMEMGQNF